MPKPQQLNKRLVAVLAFLMLMHIVFSLTFVFNIPLKAIERNTLLKYYKSYATLGPFFTNKNVKSTYDLAFRFKNNAWSEWVYPVNTNHRKYLNMGSFQNLKRAEFEKYLAYLYVREDDLMAKVGLFDYLLDNYLPKGPVDSIEVVVLRKYQSESNIQADTLRDIKHQVH